MNCLPAAVFGSCHVQLARPPVLLAWWEAGSGLPASLPVQDTDPLMPLPVLASLTVIEAVNDLPACALPTLSLPAESLGGAVAVIVRVVEAVAPESSVTVSLAVYVPALAYWWIAVAPVAVAPSPNAQAYAVID